MNRVRIMQGRLSPPMPDNPQYFPTDRWQREFALASELGFDTIEWLIDEASHANNPMLSKEGRQRIRETVEANGVHLMSVCADYFKDHTLADLNPFARSTRTALLIRLIEAAADLGIGCVLVPFLEGSTIRSPQAQRVAGDALKEPLDIAASAEVSIGVETDLPAEVLGSWVSEMDHPSLGVYYDLGNAVASGFDPAQEIIYLGTWLLGVHVKDRTFHGPNVPLGTGSVDFPACFRSIHNTGFRGPLVLETARGGDYYGDAKRYLTFVTQHTNAVSQELSPR